jgi:sugar/nucleoside kinase (ribokinase family)
MDVACLGILVADILANPIEKLPASGELKLTDRIFMNIGGCAANTAADLRRLGRKVRVLGKVGKDMFGDFVLQELERYGIDSSTVKRSETYPTSSTCIINVRGEDRRFIHCIGANADFTLADVDFSTLADARALYVGGYMVIPGFGPDDLTKLLQEAKRRGLITALDVVLEMGKPASLAAVERALPYTDVFLPNDDEAWALTGEKDPKDQAEALARLNPNCAIVITQGRAGALARRGDEVLQAGIYKVDSIDGSGAGDAFDAGFLVGLLENWPLDYTLKFASAVGASCTRALGTTQGVFDFDEAVAFVAQNPLETKELR